MSDAELREDATAEGESVEVLAEHAALMIEDAIKLSGRERLVRARKDLDASRHAQSARVASIDESRARKIFDRVRQRDRELAVQTIAARGGTPPSDAQLVEILRDWERLGVLFETDFKD